MSKISKFMTSAIRGRIAEHFLGGHYIYKHSTHTTKTHAHASAGQRPKVLSLPIQLTAEVGLNQDQVEGACPTAPLVH